MDIVCQHPIPTELFLSKRRSAAGTRATSGLLLAKLTFEVAADGSVSLCEDAPLPLLDNDVETPLGLMARDCVPNGNQPGVEVHLLAQAHVAGGATEASVEAAIGDHRVMASVTGHREWIRTERGFAVSPPRPFFTMPLSWQYAFGGATEVWLDSATVYEIHHPQNRYGRGFDPAPQALAAARTIGAAAGYPRYETGRELPNVEHAGERVQTATDAPRPFALTPMPLDLGLRALDALAMVGTDTHDAIEAAERLARSAPQKRALRFAPRELQLPTLPSGTPVSLKGMNSSGEMRFRIPPTRCVADYEFGARRGSLVLDVRRLLVLPDEGRFAILCGKEFRVGARSERDVSSMRLRLE